MSSDTHHPAPSPPASHPLLDAYSPSPTHQNAEASSSTHHPTPFVPATLPAEPLQDLGLPPQADYDSLDSMINALNAYARTAGYAVCQRSTNKGQADTEWAGKVIRGTIVCQKSGKHRENHKYLKESGRMRSSQAYTRKSDCPFNLRMTLDKETRRFRYTVECGEHNHGYIDPSLFPVHRRVDDATLEVIRAAYRDGLRTTPLLHDLLERDPHTLITHRDLENIRAAIAKEEKAKGGAVPSSRDQPHRPTRMLLKSLEEGGKAIVYRHWVEGSTNELAGLVVADPTGMALARRYAQVLVMAVEEVPLGPGSTTWTTTSHSFRHVLQIRSNSPTDHIFTVASCYIKHPHDLVSYTTAIRLLVDLIPDLPTGVVVTTDEGDRDDSLASSPLIRQACEQIRPTWRHLIDPSTVIASVRARCGALSTDDSLALTDEWQMLIASPSIAAYESTLARFRTRWSDGAAAEVVGYCLARLEKDGHAFVTCLTNEVMHFGRTRVDGMGAVDTREDLDGRMDVADGRIGEVEEDEVGNGNGNSRTLAEEAEHTRPARTYGLDDLIYPIGIMQRYNEAAIENALQAMEVDAGYTAGLPMGPVFSRLRSHISRLALDKIASEYALAGSTSLQSLLAQDHVDCVDNVSRTLGLPCSHVLMPLLSRELAAVDGAMVPIPLEWVHAHWRLDSREAIEGDARALMEGWRAVPPPKLGGMGGATSAEDDQSEADTRSENARGGSSTGQGTKAGQARRRKRKVADGLDRPAKTKTRKSAKQASANVIPTSSERDSPEELRHDTNAIPGDAYEHDYAPELLIEGPASDEEGESGVVQREGDEADERVYLPHGDGVSQDGGYGEGGQGYVAPPPQHGVVYPQTQGYHGGYLHPAAYAHQHGYAVGEWER